MAVTAMELAGNIARDAHARGGSAGVRHGTGDVGCPRCAIVNRRGVRRLSPAARRVTEGHILNEAREGHGIAGSMGYLEGDSNRSLQYSAGMVDCSQVPS